MKKLLILLLLGIGPIAMAQNNGYEISVTLKPFKNQWIYLGHHFGKQLPIIDSIKLDDKSRGVFKGNKKLGGGIYLVGYPDKSGYFEIIIDKEQKFSLNADTATIRNKIEFQNSPDNILFSDYQEFMAVQGRILDTAFKLRKAATNKADSARWGEVIEKANKNIQEYRENVMKKNPNATITFLFNAMKEPEIPPADKHPGGKYDSAFAFNYFKSHYWDGVSFFDDRVIRTPFFENKLDKYFDQLVYPHPDSVKKEIDWMLGYASVNEEMQKFLLLKFANRYLNQRFMWEDAVYVHLFEKYFAQKNYPWLTEKGRKTLTDRAYSMMANILGNAAADIDLPDSSGKNISLYSIESPYVVLALYDPTCGHCKEILPKLDSLYRAKWKNQGVKMFGLAKETDGKRSDWIKFINDNKLQNWIHVYYSKADDKARTDAGIPGYSQLYDVVSFPTLYLLDKDKRIIAKKLTYQQIDEVLQHKIRAKQAK